MKNLLTITALIGLATFFSYGQGIVNFNAGGSTATRIATNSTFGGPSTGLISGPVGSYYFALFIAPTSNGTNYSLSPSLDPTQSGFSLVSSPSGPYATNLAIAGRFSGNPAATDNLIVNGYPTFSSANFVVVGWSANIAGRDWNAFQAWWNNGNVAGPVGWAGHSLVATSVTLGGGIQPAGNIFGGNPGQIPGFTLKLIPEPSPFSLLVFGVAGFLVFRRRRLKPLLTAVALLGVVSQAFSQGTVNFSAGASAATRIATNSGGGITGLITGTSSYYFALFVAPTTVGTNWGSSASLDPTTAGFSLVNGGAYATNTLAGRFSGNPTSTDPLTVNGYPTSSSANFVVVGWSANIAGPNWNSFLTWWYGGGSGPYVGWVGHSLVASNVQLGGGAIPAGNIFGANTGQIPGFTLSLVPEPSLPALAALAATGVLIFHRRKL